MNRCVWIALVVFAGLLPGEAADISGAITSTLVITEDSWLTGNVTCKVENAPCIRVEASNITLWLNGFAITGQGDAPNRCLAGPNNTEHGIEVTRQRRVEVLGPGLVNRHRGWGIYLGESTTRSTLKGITISSNCLSGVQLWENTNENLLEGLVSVRNGSPDAGCGGICSNRSHYNRYVRNILSGNGYAVFPTNLNFGIAVSGRGNTVAENMITGNVTGIHVPASAVDNAFHRNIITGNPPIQIPVSVPEFRGFDIRNLSPGMANRFSDNVCETYSGEGNSPCTSGAGDLISIFRLFLRGPVAR